jgi:hypothetical protein
VATVIVIGSVAEAAVTVLEAADGFPFGSTQTATRLYVFAPAVAE